MPFYAHRCQRPTCNHPDYWSQSARNAESVTAGMTVDGVPAAQWALQRGGKRLLRASCGMAGAPGYKGCTECRNGCLYTTELFEVGQMTIDEPASKFFAPGEETTGAEWFNSKIFACSCDACRGAYALRTND